MEKPAGAAVASGISLVSIIFLLSMALYGLLVDMEKAQDAIRDLRQQQESIQNDEGASAMAHTVALGAVQMLKQQADRNEARLRQLESDLLATFHSLQEVAGRVQQLEARASHYHPTREECDDDPWTTASGERSRPMWHCALSPWAEKWTGARFGDLVVVPGVPSGRPDGAWIFADRMNQNTQGIGVDLMWPVGQRGVHLENTSIYVLKRR